MGDATWQGLNKRQQQYLQAIYEVDQEQEEQEGKRFNQGYTSRKAEEWRWIDYFTTGVFYPVDSLLKAKIRELKLIDEGTGSTFNALEARGFIVCRYVYQDRDGKYAFDESILSLQITKAGRKLVRDATGTKPTKRKPGELTPAQQKYADKIIAADIAPREEVENAFRLKQDERISRWGSVLGMVQRREEEEYNKTHPIIVHCAYCGKEMKMYRRQWGEYTLSPARYVDVEHTVAGFSWGGWTSNATKEHKRFDFYACDEHKEQVKYAEMKLSVTLDFESEENRRIEAIQYPIAAREEARFKLMQDIRFIAWRDVAQSDERDLVHTRTRIKRKAQQSYDAFIASADPEKLTDNLELFVGYYLAEYARGYKDAIDIRKEIDEGQYEHYQNNAIWQEYYQRTHTE